MTKVKVAIQGYTDAPIPEGMQLVEGPDTPEARVSNGAGKLSVTKAAVAELVRSVEQWRGNS